MFIVDVVRHRDHSIIKTPIAGLVATDQKDCGPAWVDGIEHTKWLAAALHTQFRHLSASVLQSGIDFSDKLYCVGRAIVAQPSAVNALQLSEPNCSPSYHSNTTTSASATYSSSASPGSVARIIAVSFRFAASKSSLAQIIVARWLVSKWVFCTFQASCSQV